MNPTSKPSPRQNASDGFIVVAVLWILGALATLASIYAVYVIVNLTLFLLRDPEPMREGVLFGVIYALVALGVSWGAVWLLSQRRAALT